MINERYTVARLLGRGGMGVVFLAHDTVRGNEPCAVKVLLSEHEDPDQIADRFRNEVSLLLGLAHPNLVRILDAGTVRSASEDSLVGRLFYTMEYVDGPHLLSWTETTGEDRRSDRVLEPLLLQALSALSYVHREGVTHFDIKPQNLIVSGGSDGKSLPELTLMDFGLSERQGSNAGRALRGTLEYAAPELLQGRPHDHRVDLYSLGATFFHLMEGRCPFESSDPTELARMVISATPEFLRRGEETLIRATVRRLLSKDPDGRFRSAEDAAAFMLRGTQDATGTMSRYFGFSRKPRFVNRHPEYNFVAQHLQSMADGKPGAAITAAVLTGPDGIGKTALLTECGKAAVRLGLSVFRTQPSSGTVPFSSLGLAAGTLRAALRAWSQDGKRIAEEMETAGRSGRLPDHGVSVAPDSIEGVQSRSERLARSFADASHLFPVVLIADDLHALDDASARTIRSIVSVAAPGRLLVLGAEAGDSPRVLTGGSTHALRLEELREDAVSSMASDTFGSSPGAETAGKRIYDRYGGVPAVLVEAFRVAGERYLFVRPPEGDPGGIPPFADIEKTLPDSLEDLLIGRFRALGKDRQLTLTMLACFRHPAPLGVMRSLLPFHHGHLIECLRFLQADGYITYDENSREVSFRLQALREPALAALGGPSADTHKLIAGSLEETPHPQTLAVRLELAHQYRQAGNMEKASETYLSAAEEALRLLSVDQAVSLLREGLDLCTLKPRPVQIRLADTLLVSGKLSEAVDLARTLLEEGKPGDGEIHRIIGLALARRGQNDEARTHIEKAIAATTDESSRLELSKELTSLDITAGRFADARSDSTQQLALAKSLGRNRLIGDILTNLGIVSFLTEQFAESSRLFGESREAYESSGDWPKVINALNNVGNALSAAGDFPKALTIWDEALTLCRSRGTMSQQAKIQNNRGIAYYNLKQFPEARNCYSEARTINDRLGDRIGVASTLVNTGEVEFAEGGYETALRHWTEARDLFRKIEDPHAILETTIHLCEVALAIGDATRASQFLHDASAVLETNRIEAFEWDVAFLGGTLQLLRKDFAGAIGCFTGLRDRTPGRDPVNNLARCELRRAEACLGAGEYADAISSARKVLAMTGAAGFLLGESHCLLGSIARLEPTATGDQPLVHYTRGFTMIEHEPVGELTWKLLYCLGQEYLRRGQSERAAGFLRKAKAVLDYMISLFHTPELRELYLAVEDKESVLKEIEGHLGS